MILSLSVHAPGEDRIAVAKRIAQKPVSKRLYHRADILGVEDIYRYTPMLIKHFFNRYTKKILSDVNKIIWPNKHKMHDDKIF